MMMKSSVKAIFGLSVFVLLLCTSVLLSLSASAYADDAAALAGGMKARIGEAADGAYYGSLHAALNAVREGETVTLLADDTLSPVSISVSFTLNGGDHTLSATGASGAYLFTLTGKTVTIDHLRVSDNTADGVILVASNTSLTVSNCSFTAKNGIKVNESCIAGVTLASNTIQTTGIVFRSDISATLTLDIASGTYASTASYAMIIGGGTGSTVTITGGRFLGNSVGDVTLEFRSGGGLTANLYGGYFEGQKLACVRAHSNTVLTIWGGVYDFDPALNSVSGSAVRAGTTTSTGNTVVIKGGHFYSKSVAGVLMNCVAGSSLTLEAYTAQGGGCVLYNAGTGTPSVWYANGDNHASLNTPITQTGAQVRLVPGSSGLRFIGIVNSDTIAYLSGIADGGKFSFGTLLVPEAYLSRLTQFTKEELEYSGLSYVEIPAVNGIVRDESTGQITLRAALVNIKSSHYDMSFSAVHYVQYEVNGHTVRLYSSFYAVKNSRKIADVAYTAQNDVKTSPTGKYIYLVDALGMYSPYTSAQRTVLSGYCEGYTTKTLDVYLIAGQSNANGSTRINDAFIASDGAFADGYSHIFFSGSCCAPTSGFLSRNVFDMEPVRASMGRCDYYMGPELGMAKALSQWYNEETGATAAIIKYAAGGTPLLESNNGEGSWTPPSYLAAHGAKYEKSGGLYRNFIARVTSALSDYSVRGYEIHIKALYWMQGETDATAANVSTLYPEMFAFLVKDLRTDLGEITGEDLSEMPVLAGEISELFNLSRGESYAAFIKMQESMVKGLSNVYVNPVSAKLASGTDATDTGHYAADDALYIGRTVGTKLYAYTHGISDAPLTYGSYCAEVWAADGTRLGEYDSLSYAINSAPAGATVKLLRDVALYASLSLCNTAKVTLDGNGYTLTSYSTYDGMRLFGCEITLKNVIFNLLTDSADTRGIYLYEGAKLSVRGGSFSAYSKLFTVNEAASLTVYSGSFATRASASLSDSVIALGGNATVRVYGGTFTASGAGSALYMGSSETNSADIVLYGGTFVGSGTAAYTVYVADTDTLLDTDPYSDITVSAGTTGSVYNAGRGLITSASAVTIKADRYELPLTPVSL